MVTILNNEGVGINVIARISDISPGTVINYLRKISRNIHIAIPDEHEQYMK